jgi:nucleoid DNA-binding protein
MVKADIVRSVAATLSMKDKDALFVVDSIIDSLKEVILAEGRLEIRDFGVFQVKERKPRIGRNPKNKKTYPIPPHKVVTFKAGKELKNLPLATSGEDDEEADQLE